MSGRFELPISMRIGRRIGSVATRGEDAPSLPCAAALLAGPAGAAFGLCWLHPAAAPAFAALAVREGIQAFSGESRCIPDPIADTDTRHHDCCGPQR